MSYNLIGFAGLSLLVLIFGAAVGSSGRTRIPTRLVVAAFALRIVGSFFRYEILMEFYNGIGDATGYYGGGRVFAQQLWNLDFSVLSWDQWFGFHGWWGTEFLRNLSGLVVTFIGPSMRAEFLAFSLISFAGLYMMVVAFSRYALQPAVNRFAAFVFLWPSLWFWPSSVGKEAITVLAMGMVTLGLVDRKRLGWGLFLGGIALSFAIRPHVAAALALAAGAAYWLGTWERVTGRRILEGALVLVLGAVMFVQMSAQFGFESADLEGLQEFVEYRARTTIQGGSAIESVPARGAALPMAFVNIWMRPFPWEAHNATAAVSALEIVLLWVLLFRHRKLILRSVRGWRRHPLLRFAFPLLLGYTLMIGITFGNLGIIARQRAPVFPYLFMFAAAAYTAPAPRRRRVPSHRRAVVRDRPATRRNETDLEWGPSP